jgi:hypothetical protein
VSVALIRAEIKTILSGVAGVGIVHDYDRWSADWTTFFALFKSGAEIRGWQIARTKTEEIGGKGETKRTHTFRLRGILGLDDSAATGKAFDDVVETVENAFDDAITLNGKATSAGPLQVDAIEIRMFGSVLCHTAECRLPATEILTY